ncbi:MAG: efflux RND transporter periplasmic adaptor subunit, partial [Parvularculaceae bacterium]
KREQEIAVARARADYDIAKTNAARFEGLVADEAASALEDEAARNELSAATAQLRQAEYELSRRTIRAPFAGVVGLTKLNIGDFLQAGSTVTTIDDVSSLLVDFVVPEGASAYVKEGLEVTAIAQASSGLEVKGRIRAVDSRVDSASRTRRIEAILANDENALIPGSTFAISLVAPGRQAIVVPGLALQWDRAGSFVWKAGPDGAAERVPVVVLQRNAQAILVESALTSSDLIVSEGAAMVRAGAALMSQGADAHTSGNDGSSD